MRVRARVCVWFYFLAVSLVGECLCTGARRLHKAKQEEAILNAALKKAEEDKDFVKPSQVRDGKIS